MDYIDVSVDEEMYQLSFQAQDHNQDVHIYGRCNFSGEVQHITINKLEFEKMIEVYRNATN